MRSQAKRNVTNGLPKVANATARSLAASCLVQIMQQGRSLSVVLDEQLSIFPVGHERALTQELCYGVLRWGPRLQAIAGQLLQKPLKKKDGDVYALILIGLYQSLYMRIPDHALVTETVAATRVLNKPWAKGLVNAVLRSFQRQKESLLLSADQNEEAQSAHPLWLLELLKQAWPSDWQAIVAANNQRPPMTLRVNCLKQSRDDYLLRLNEVEIKAHAVDSVESAIELESPLDVGRLPGFDQGDVSVQDAAAQLAAGLLDLSPDHRVLDACTAPGGKACHILEVEPDLAGLVAVDKDEKRLQRVEMNLARLGFQAELIAADVTETSKWWDGQLFDRILVDAPCSATGVIRRHPDIKYLRRDSDITQLEQQQRNILKALWPLLKPNGRLVYATCSIFPQENSQQIKHFIDAHDDAREAVVSAAWVQEQAGDESVCGRQIMTGVAGMDGFYYACLLKQRES